LEASGKRKGVINSRTKHLVAWGGGGGKTWGGGGKRFPEKMAPLENPSSTQRTNGASPFYDLSPEEKTTKIWKRRKMIILNGKRNRASRHENGHKGGKNQPRLIPHRYGL